MNVIEALKQVTISIKEWTDENKVAKISGKGLSTNDYTDADKDKLNSISQIPNDLVVLDNKLYLAQDGVIMDESAVTLPTGGGGGGGTSDAITLINNLPSTTITSIVGGDVLLKFNYSSSEDENGTAYIYVDDVLKTSTKIVTGDNTIPIGAYVKEGTNVIKLTCVDQYSNSKSLSYTAEILSLQLSSVFNSTVPYDSDINYTYIPIINMPKTVHFILDGSEIGTEEVTTSGRQETYVIPKQPHGSHTLEVYFTVKINDVDIPSNHLYYDLICIDDGATTPVIACSYINKQITQFETITIPYIVYSPTSLTSDIVLSANDEVVGELTVDRTQQTWSFRADDYGELTLTIACGVITKTLKFDVSKSEINVNATTANLELYLSSYGRSNNELNPAIWNYNDIACKFEDYNWVSDGWLKDENGYSIHRVSGDARLTIPLKMFADDFRTTGKTIEFEFQTRNVRNYDAEIISCYSGDIGFKLTAQEAILKSEQTEISTQYKEDEHIRVAFVIEKKTANRLVLIYLNGIMCGAAQYPTDDDFSQASPVEISIGSNDCVIDLYNIRVYNNDLTRYQILDNWIADTQDVALRAERYSRNNIFDAYGNIVIKNLPTNLPYIVLKGKTLPQYKGNKLSVNGEFVDPVNPENSFEFTSAQIDVQGTSSAGYARKNYKLKLKSGLIQNGVVKNSYQMRGSGHAADVFCFKADVASSEGANNVELVKQYNDISPYRTPAQQTNPNYRQGIDGFPMVIFHDDGNEIKFIGKYNFNFDKSSGHWGFADGDESWEVKNNTSDRVIWKNADFEGDDWKNDFESMFPEDYTDISRLKNFAEWVVSTDREAATNEVFEAPITVDNVEYTADTAEYRLAKFKYELKDYCEVDSAVFYYLFSLLYLSIDTRAKNTFPSWQGDSKLYWIAYDWDSTVGIDNVGSLKFGYELEDIDILPSGATPFNGQDSVFWCNVRDTYSKEIKTMYQDLRSNDKLSYEITEKAYEDHQAIWPEAIWNEDAYYKYLEPLIEDGAGIYLPMLQGSKSEQRKWWLYNRFRYIDSKYNAGDALKDFITLRGYAKSDITVTPYADIYASIKYGSYLEQVRALRGSSYTLECPLDNVNDTEIYIYSASQLKDVGDLSGLKVGLADFSMATKLQALKVGDKDPSYNNGNLNSLTLGNNILLKTIDARNCSALGTGEQQSLDISGCTNIEQIYLTGTALKGVTIPVGGILKTLHLPDTVTNLTVRNQPSLTDFVLNNSSNLTTLRLENVGSLIDTPNVIKNMADGGRIRALDIDWEVESESDLLALLNKLIKMRGLDENGNNLDAAVLTGRIRVNEKVSDETVGEFYNYFADVVIDDGSEEIYIINYKNWDGSILYSMRLAEGADAIDPIEENLIDAPTRPSDEYYSYEFIGWNVIPTNVSRHYIVTAQYHTKVAVNFAVDGEIIHSEYVIYGSNAEDPVANGTIDAPTKEGTDDLHYVFDSWDGSLLNITMPRIVNALFANVYPVRFYATEGAITPHYVQWIKEGEDAHDPSTDEGYTVPPEIMVSEDEKQVFSAWGNLPTNVTAICQVYAIYDTYWAVRFYNESVVVNTQWIKDGESAIDPIKNNIIETPTKTSTAQYDFTFKSWDGDYINVTETRNIYATYSYITRRYTVEFYNVEDGVEVFLWKQEEVPYGSDAINPVTSGQIATPVKLGVEDPTKYDYTGWNPSYKEIQGDTKCYAMFRYNDYIQDDWATIAANVNNDTATTLYPIGARKEIPITLSDGVEYTVDVEIIAYNHDDLADGSGKATLTFLCKELPDFERKMYNNQTNSGGWQDSDMRTFVNGELFNGMPTELQNVIAPVYKISDGGANNKALVTTEDKCWIPSYDEVGFANNRTDNIPGQGTQYSDTFGYGSSGNATRIKYLSDGYTSGRWWLRSSSYGSSSVLYFRVQNSGGVQTDGLWNSYPVAFGFCIGKSNVQPSSATVGDVTVNGIVGSSMTNESVVVTLANDTFKSTIYGTWITNLPDGLTQIVTRNSDNKATIMISGTPTEVYTDTIKISIPADNLLSNMDLVVTENNNAKFNITESEPVKPSATVSNITVSGENGSAITNTNVVVALTNDTFKSEIYGNWITNLPTGLTQEVQRNGDNQATITISGTPLQTSTAVMNIRIPAINLSSNTDIIVTENSNAKFNITEPEIVEPEVVEPGIVSYGNRAAQIASTYQLTRALGDDTFAYSTNSLFSEDGAGDGHSVRDANGYGVMDCSTFVGLCLRGIPYEKSPFAIHKGANAVWEPADELSAMYGTEGWEFRDLDRQPSGKYHNIGISGYSTIRYAADYGKYFSDNGQVLFDSEKDGEPVPELWKTLKLQPGDLLFWSKASASDEVKERFKSISHVAIVPENPSHFFEVTTGEKVVLYSKFEEKYEEISLICRPIYKTRTLPVGENILSYPWVYGALATSTTSGIICKTIDSNTISLSGTSTAEINRRIKGNTSTGMAYTLPAGKYKLSGMDNTGVSNSSVSLQIKNIDGTDFATPIVCYAGNNPTFTITKDTDIAILLHIDIGCTLNCNITPTLARTT